MKIAITGHSAGIGLALSNLYQARGHEVIGLSRRNGFNIRSIPKIISQVEPCDIFINNAQVGFAQTELLFAMYELWSNKNKTIINISTMMTSEPSSCLPGFDMIQYYVQKKTLEEAIVQLRGLHQWPRLILVKPGGVATQPDQISPRPYANVDTWADYIVNTLDAGSELEVYEIALGVKF